MEKNRMCMCVCVLDKAPIFKLDLDLEHFPSKQLQGLPKDRFGLFLEFFFGVSWPGYINKPHNKQGTDLQVVVRGKRYPAKVWVSQSKKHEA